jgi:hypothetical protein
MIEIVLNTTTLCQSYKKSQTALQAKIPVGCLAKSLKLLVFLLQSKSFTLPELF